VHDPIDRPIAKTEIAREHACGIVLQFVPVIKTAQDNRLVSISRAKTLLQLICGTSAGEKDCRNQSCEQQYEKKTRDPRRANHGKQS
jgi:hypothetical protein